MSIEFDEDFLPEIEENVEGMETVLLELSDSISEEEINKLAFFAHNFKGSSQIAGLDELAKYLHEFENILVSLKSGDLTWSAEILSFFFTWIDNIKTFGSGYARQELIPLDFGWVAESHKNFLESNPSTPTEIVAKSEPEPQSEEKKEEVVPKVSKPEVKEAEKPKDNPQAAAPEFIRTNIEKLDNLLNFVGELVINQSILNNYRDNDNMNDRRVFDTIDYLNKIVHDISTSTLSLRMIPLKRFFQKIKRIASDVSAIQKKPVRVVLHGEDVELDKTIVDKITDPIIHIIKNAIDHGLESPEERVAKGKPREGTLTVQAIQKESVAEILISDNGGGLNKERIFKKAVEKKFISESDDPTDEQIWNFIFHPGFSTAGEVTEISGRGVGMDVVKRVIEGLQGNIFIHSSPEGTTFKLIIPLSLSIINGMIVEVQKEKFIVPVSQLIETVELKNFQVEKTGKGRVLNLRGHIIPVLSLGRILRMQNKDSDKTEFENEKALVVQVDGEKISFEVDEIVEQQQIVVKKFGDEMEDIPGLSGGAILSDGEPGIILNIQEIFTGGMGHG